MDFGTITWTVPTERMKGGRSKAMPPYRVPLMEPMLAVLAWVAGGPDQPGDAAGGAGGQGHGAKAPDRACAAWSWKRPRPSSRQPNRYYYAGARSHRLKAISRTEDYPVIQIVRGLVAQGQDQGKFHVGGA